MDWVFDFNQWGSMAMAVVFALVLLGALVLDLT